jgi:hypothetical protein
VHGRLVRFPGDGRALFLCLFEASSFNPWNRFMQQLKLFDTHHIRSRFHKGEWWYSIIDVVGALTESYNPRRYWSDLKRDIYEREGYAQVYAKIVQLKFIAPDGRLRHSDAANTETLLRLIQSIPSSKAEPFKQWLAQLGHERLQEHANPELAISRGCALYDAKGYDQTWIDQRVRGIGKRHALTDEWSKRGIEQPSDFARLTATVARATFGLAPKEHKALKGLKSENLRDHMTSLELTLTMLGEEAVKEMSRVFDAQGYEENRHAAYEGGSIAGIARKALELKIGRSVVSSRNALPGSRSIQTSFSTFRKQFAD